MRGDRGSLAGAQRKVSSRGVDCGESPDTVFRKLKPGPGMDAVAVASHQRARIHSAMLDLVAERGYDAVTVRDLAGAAGVSTRSFYKHYSSKEQCFLRVHRLITHRVLRVFGSSHEGVSREAGIRLGVEAIMRVWASEPKAARLLCMDAYAAGPAALKQAEWARRTIEAAIVESLGDKFEAAGSLLIAEAIVAGIFSATRHCLLDGKARLDPQLRDALMAWTVECCGAFLRLEELQRVTAPGGLEHDASLISVRSQNEDRREKAMSSKGDVIALHSVAAKLAATHIYQNLSVSKLVEAAGVSRRTFNANFSSMDACFLAVLESKAVEAMAKVREASKGGATPEEGVYRALVALCDRAAGDASFASLCFDASVVPGLPKMRSQRALTRKLACLITDRLATVGPVDRVTAQASAGAICGVIQNQVDMGRVSELHGKAPLLTYLLLAPTVGPSAAMRAVHREHLLTT